MCRGSDGKATGEVPWKRRGRVEPVLCDFSCKKPEKRAKKGVLYAFSYKTPRFDARAGHFVWIFIQNA
jgi:hypothetical protein